MRRTALLALPIWLIAAPMAQAGAWLREDGALMLAFSHEMTRPGGGGDSAGYTSLYAEYGLTEKLTIGLDAGKGEAADDWKAVAFVQMGREFDWLPGRVAAEFGLGAAGSSETGVEAVIQPGISWGHSFETERGWAWVNVDAKAVIQLAAATETGSIQTVAGLPMALRDGYKLDMTLGLNLNPRTQVSVEMRFEAPAEGDNSLRLVPGVARRLGERSWVTLGGVVSLGDAGSVGVVLGSRIEF
ncbi:MAG: hypothetical protein ACP5EN_10650 [Rhodovulum sp.]